MGLTKIRQTNKQKWDSNLIGVLHLNPATPILFPQRKRSLNNVNAYKF